MIYFYFASTRSKVLFSNNHSVFFGVEDLKWTALQNKYSGLFWPLCLKYHCKDREEYYCSRKWIQKWKRAWCSSSQPANRLTAWLYTHGSHLTPLPPTWGPGSVNQHAYHADGQTGQRSQFTCPVYIATYHPIKPVHSESLSVTVPVVIRTCTVLILVPPQELHCLLKSKKMAPGIKIQFFLVCTFDPRTLFPSFCSCSPGPRIQAQGQLSAASAPCPVLL